MSHPVLWGRARSLVFSGEKSISSVHTGGVTWLDLDCVEERYLLAGAADGSVAAYDVQACRVLLSNAASGSLAVSHCSLWTWNSKSCSNKYTSAPLTGSQHLSRD